MFDEFLRAAEDIYAEAEQDGRLLCNPTNERLYELAAKEPGIRTTKYGSLAADSEPSNRAAMFTSNNIDQPFGAEEARLLADAKRRLKQEKLVSIDVYVGDGSAKVTARLVMPLRFAHLPYGGQKLFGRTKAKHPTYWILMCFDEEFAANRSRKLPDKKNLTIRHCLSPDGRLVKFVRNSNYLGEWKKGIFTGEDWRVKLKGDAIFLHAGCRQDTLETSHGGYQTQTSMFVALSANGKTSTTCKVLARKGAEKSWLIQDDGGTLTRDGRFLGWEKGGLFIKTDGLNPKTQIEAYYATLRGSAYLENVGLSPDLDIDFYDITRTSNGRSIVERRDFMHASGDINVDRVDNLFLITRGPIIPAVARLTQAQAAAFMVLGQSMESSAGDPTQAGKIKNCFFYDPFVAGNKTDHANLFYDLLRGNPHINCFLLNTGHIGEGENFHDISLADTMGVLDSVLRGGLEDWVVSEKTGLLVPSSIRTVDSILLHPEKVYPPDVFDAKQRELDQHRAHYLEQFPGLHPDIRQVFIK